MKPTKILVVDDESDLEFLIARKFKTRIQMGELQFLFAPNGVEALDILQQYPDVLVALVDIEMPRMDGLTLLSHIHERYPQIYSIIVSAYSDIPNIRRGIALRIYDFLTKPINFQDLTLTLDRAIQQNTLRIQEIEARKKAEDALLRERNLLRTLIDTLPDVIYAKDRRSRFLLNNIASIRALGSPPKVFGTTDADFFPKELAEQYYADEQQIFQSGQPLVNREEPMLNPETGETQWVLTTKAPFHDAQGQIVGVVGINRDITEIKRARETLQASQQQYRELAEKVADGIAVVQKGRIVFVNPALCTILGASSDQILQMRPADLDLQQSAPLCGDPNDATWHLKHTLRGNHMVWLEISQHTISWEGQPAQLATVHDITEHKLHELALEQEQQRLYQQNLVLQDHIREHGRLGLLIGQSQSMQRVYDLVVVAAATTLPVVIFGETGTGKELVARTIHQLSSRTDQPFVALNCGAITESLAESELFGHRKGAFTGALTDKQGVFDRANHGTLLLDEIGELSLEVQVKLLRVLEIGEYLPVGGIETKKADVRLLAATHRNLADMVENGTFREDLFYRLLTLDIMVPPLRDRLEDLSLLSAHFVERLGKDLPYKRLPKDILKQLSAYHWPGNVRQLQNVIGRYLATRELIFTDTRKIEALEPLPYFETENQTLADALRECEKKTITRTLEHTNWHREQAAELLGVPPRTLRRKIREYEIIEPYQKKPPRTTT